MMPAMLRENVLREIASTTLRSESDAEWLGYYAWFLSRLTLGQDVGEGWQASAANAFKAAKAYVDSDAAESQTRRRDYPKDCASCGLWLTAESLDCPRCFTKEP